MRITCYGDEHPSIHDTTLGWALVVPVGFDPGQSCNAKVFRSTLSESPKTETTLPCCHQEHVKSVEISFHTGIDVFATHLDDDLLDYLAEEKCFLDIVKTMWLKMFKEILNCPYPLRRRRCCQKNKLAVCMRSRNTFRKVSNDPTLSFKYCEIMQSYLQVYTKKFQTTHAWLKPFRSRKLRSLSPKFI